jgi:hypothetical protein
LARALAERSIRRVCPRPGAVVLNLPDQRSIAARFRDAVRVYYAGDDFTSSYGWPADTVVSWERRIVGEVDHVVLISRELAHRFRARYQVESTRLHVSPSAVAGEYIPPSPPGRPAPLPAVVPAGFRPLAGVLGTISQRIVRWLRRAVDAVPWLHWVFVGPVKEMDEAHRVDLEALQSHPRCCFVGPQPYEALFSFAAVDLAVIAFDESGSIPPAAPCDSSPASFGQPILATPGCAQLENSSLVRLCRTAEVLIEALAELRDQDFDDGLRHARWAAARQHTWDARAAQLVNLIHVER